MRTAVRLLLLPLAFAACSSGDPAAPAPGPGSGPGSGQAISDQQLFALSQRQVQWRFYKDRADTLNRSSGSGHPEPRLVTRFDPIAARQLGTDGKVRAGAVFPDSSLIVKDLISGGALLTVAVMYKLRGNPNAGSSGWLWAEYGPTGATKIAVSGRGGSCESCHRVGIDFTRMNDSHP